MQEMASENPETFSSSIDFNLEITMKDFPKASKAIKKTKYIEHCDGNFNIWISVSASPNGFNGDTQGWLMIRPYVTILRGKYRPQNCTVSWIVGLIDIDDNTRFSRSFMQNLSKDITDAKYLERSFILSRADEFLREGVLTLSCDICFQWYDASLPLDADAHTKITRHAVPYVPNPDSELVDNDPEAEIPPIDHQDFVNKNKILTEVVYLANLEKVFGVCDPPSLEGRHPNAWAFVTNDESFNVILDDRRNNLGSKLLKSSAVFRQCVNSPMREQREKCIQLPDVDSQTFKIVIYFVTKQTLPKFGFNVLMDIYKFSHMYEMEELQRHCAEDMVNSLEHESEFKELQKFADFYLDEYLSDLLRTHPRECENLTEKYIA